MTKSNQNYLRVTTKTPENSERESWHTDQTEIKNSRSPVPLVQRQPQKYFNVASFPTAIQMKTKVNARAQHIWVVGVKTKKIQPTHQLTSLTLKFNDYHHHHQENKDFIFI